MDITSANELCAFCLDHTDQMYSLSSKSIKELVKYALNIEILESRKNYYPKFLCSACKDKIKAAKDLKERFVNVHKQLDDIIKNIHPNKYQVMYVIARMTEFIECSNIVIFNFREDDPVPKIHVKFQTDDQEKLANNITKKHSLNKDSKSSIECYICHLNFPTKLSKTQHLTITHTGYQKCSHCQVILESSVKLDQHIKKIHQKFFTFICEICGRGFEFKHYLAKHTLLKHEQKNYHTCDICGTTIKVKSNFLRHMKLHLNQNFQCESCLISYSTKSSLNNHLFQVHNVQPPLKCSNCNRGFSFLSELENHQKNIKMNRTCKPFKASQSVKLNNIVELDYSIDRVNSVYKCKLCDKVYQYSGSLHVHKEAVHSGQTFKCQYCEKTFKNSNNKRRHETTHIIDKRYNCKECDKKFHQKSQLLVHERSHTGNFAFNCFT